VALVLGLVLGAAAGCKRRLSPERQMMTRLAGTWVWRDTTKKAVGATVIVLDLTAKGRYEEKTYRENRGQRKLLYMRANPPDVVEEPESSDEIARLKRERYEPAVATGRFSLALEGPFQKIIFESDKVSAVDKTAGRTSREESFTLGPGDKLNIGGRTYQR